MGVKTDVDYRTFISRFEDDHNPDTKDYKYDAEDRKDENWRSYNRVVSVLESHSNLVAKLFNAESSRELTIQVFHQCNHPKYADLLIAKKTRKCLLASFFVIIRK